MSDNKTTELPSMPDPRPTIEVGVKARLLNDFDSFSTGSLYMKICDTDAKIMRGKKHLGNVGAAVGGGIYIKMGKREWAINPLDLFNAVLDADKKQYKAKGGGK